MRPFERIAQVGALTGAFGVALILAFQLHGNGLWQGLPPASASALAVEGRPAPYDLTQLRVVNEVLKTVRDRYVDPRRVKPKEMLLSALNYVQRDVAQVIVLYDEGAPTVKVKVDTQEKDFRVDNVQGPWDVSARLREIFEFMQDGLRGTEVDLREVEYAACNGMLHTLDPHSVLLSPEAYKDMNMTTSGQFGGLGIVISIRDQQLTVMNPMPGTPASRAGVKKNDRIIKINGESTLNMGLNEAVNHLRGLQGSKVTIWVTRDGSPDATKYELTREVIHVASVESHLLDGNIGYVRLKQFQANTTADLENALDELRSHGELKGLVLDLRGNPGGLLDQAAKVVDKFVSDGPIVATVGNPSEGREEKVAHADGTEPNYPLVLLVNGSSASASEIVAGALKNHDRAVLIGETTWGKGSVQLVFTDLPDKAALKLTIAQYLTEPGDVSIQGTGVTPDIELDPMTVDSQEMDLFVDTGVMKERDLSRSLSNARAKEGQRPQDTVRYDLPIRERLDFRERGGDPDEAFNTNKLEFPVWFAREVAAHVQNGVRPDQIRQAHALIDGTRKTEFDKVAAELTAMGYDWSDAPPDMAPLATPTPPANVDVSFETDKPSNEVIAGESMNMKVTVTNHGTQTLYRVYAITKSDDPLFDNKELVFGKLEPGASKTTMAPVGWCETQGHKIGSSAPLPKDLLRVCSIPKDSLMRADGVKLHFEEARGRAPADTDIHVGIKSLERPIFAYSYEIIDNRAGNGDGRAQKGEGMTMYLTVKNIGGGRSYETQANLHNLAGDGLLLHEGRYDLSNMAPGESRKVSFTFDIQQALADPEAKVELSIVDRDLRESVVEKVRIPIVQPIAIAAGGGAMRAKAGGADLVQSPDAAGRTFGRLDPGVAATVLGTAGGYVKLSLGAGRFAFAKVADLEQGGAPAAVVAFQDAMAHAPPALELPQPMLATRDAHTSISGTASDDARLLDAYIRVGARKVWYMSNRNGADQKKLVFSAANLPLRPGVNYVTVVARENPDTTTQRTFVVRRDGPAGELLPTPKTEDDFMSEAGAADDD